MFLYSRILESLPTVAHAVSGDRGPWVAEPSEVEAFWAGLAEPLGFSVDRVARLHQVHGRDVVEVSGGGDAGEGDALITRDPGVLLAIRTADCVPILMASEGEVAAIHAGWRGLVAGVIEATTAQLRAKPVGAVVGPCICVEHYEVGPELVSAMDGCGVPRSVFLREDLGARPHVDLRKSAAWKLEQLGIEVETLDLCTWEDPRFPSYRRNGPLSGRMASLVGLRC